MGGGGWYLNLEKNGSQKLFHFAEQPAVHPTAVQSRLFSKTFTNTTTSPPPRKKKTTKQQTTRFRYRTKRNHGNYCKIFSFWINVASTSIKSASKYSHYHLLITLFGKWLQKIEAFSLAKKFKCCNSCLGSCRPSQDRKLKQLRGWAILETNKTKMYCKMWKTWHHMWKRSLIFYFVKSQNYIISF